ncbi:MAG: hypothetical protein ACT4O1_02500, partial [Gemmatimonadota bacterium]
MRVIAAAIAIAIAIAGCGRPKTPAPPPTAASAPVLRSTTVMVFPVQNGFVPSPDANARHWPADRAAVDAEIAFWLQQGTQRARWLLPETIDR